MAKKKPKGDSAPGNPVRETIDLMQQFLKASMRPVDPGWWESTDPKVADYFFTHCYAYAFGAIMARAREVGLSPPEVHVAALATFQEYFSLAVGDADVVARDMTEKTRDYAWTRLMQLGATGFTAWQSDPAAECNGLATLLGPKPAEPSAAVDPGRDVRPPAGKAPRRGRGS